MKRARARMIFFAEGMLLVCRLEDYEKDSEEWFQEIEKRRELEMLVMVVE